MEGAQARQPRQSEYLGIRSELKGFASIANITHSTQPPID
jgi:hypothetical protein